MPVLLPVTVRGSKTGWPCRDDLVPGHVALGTAGLLVGSAFFLLGIAHPPDAWTLGMAAGLLVRVAFLLLGVGALLLGAVPVGQLDTGGRPVSDVRSCGTGVHGYEPRGTPALECPCGACGGAWPAHMFVRAWADEHGGVSPDDDSGFWNPWTPNRQGAIPLD
jgi:hypothetical protein